MEWLMNNWQYIVVGIIALGGIGVGIYKFFKLPKEQRYQKVSQWLLYAVTEAEKKLGGGTGKIKLSTVYDMFISKFPILSTVLPFSTFSYLVDKALESMKELLETNVKVAEYIKASEVKEA